MYYILLLQSTRALYVLHPVTTEDAVLYILPCLCRRAPTMRHSIIPKHPRCLVLYLLVLIILSRT